MSKSNFSSKQSFHHSISNLSCQKENQKPTQFLCSKCHTSSISSISIKKEKESKKYNINILCKNLHQEEIPLSEFDMFDKKNYQKECQICKRKLEIKSIFYCYKCKKYFCLDCQCEHYKRERELVTSYYGLLENRCNFHDNKIKEYYCKDCTKYLCLDCLKTHSNEHKNVINLREKFFKYQKIMETEIGEENNLVTKYNDILNSVRKIITKNIEQKRKLLELKKSIFNSYINNNMNYFNIKNIDYAKGQINNILMFNQNKIKQLYEICKKDYIDIANNKKQ